MIRLGWTALLLVWAGAASALQLPLHPSQLSAEEARKAGISLNALRSTVNGTMVEVALAPTADCAEPAFVSVQGVEAPVRFEGRKLEIFVENRMLLQARLILQCRRTTPGGTPSPYAIGFTELADPRLSSKVPEECGYMNNLRQALIAGKSKEALALVMPCVDWYGFRHTSQKAPSRELNSPDHLLDPGASRGRYFAVFAVQLHLLAGDADFYSQGVTATDYLSVLCMAWPYGVIALGNESSVEELEHCLADELKSPKAGLFCYRERKSVYRRYGRMAVLSLKQNATIDAANYARHALAIDSYDATGMYVLAALRERNGDQEGALCLYRAALQSLKSHRPPGFLPVEYWEATSINDGVERLRKGRDLCANERKLQEFMEGAPEWAMGFEPRN